MVPRRVDLVTGYNCNSNCVFCVIGDKLFTGDRSTEDCVDELTRSRATCQDVTFTGAEVTIRPDFLRLVSEARRLGYQTIQIQTNGRMFAYEEFCKKAIAAGANEFSPSIHGHDARLHDGLTRSKGSFAQITQAIRNLKKLGQRVVTNSVITRQNTRHLPEMARLFVSLGVDQFQFAFPHPTGHADTYFNGVVPRMRELRGPVREALEIGLGAGVSCMAEAIPYCQLPGLEPHIAELFIPPTEIAYDGFLVPDYKRDRMDRGKTRFPQCAPCRFEPMCEGPWRQYPEELGSDEFQPVAGPRVVDAAVVADDRFDMLGREAPAFSLPAGDGRTVSLSEVTTRWVALVFYPEDGSPGCTAQACSVQDGLERLGESGISVLGISPDGVASHARFAAAHHLGFPLLADSDGRVAHAYRAHPPGRRGIRRSTVLLGPERRIDHVLVDPDVKNHAAQILDAVRRFEAPPRPLGKGPELVILRRKSKPEAEVAADLGLDPARPEEFAG